MTTGSGISKNFDLAMWSKLAKLGGTNAVSGLSQMINQEITVGTINLEEVSMRSAASLLGKPDEKVVGIYLLFSGATHGQILLAFQPIVAFELVDMAMGIPTGSTTSLGEMERSVLGEMGNIVGTFFLNALADSADVRLMPSPPAVVEDMVGALVNSVMAEALMENESVFVLRLTFSAVGREIQGHFLVLPAFDKKGNGGGGETG